MPVAGVPTVDPRDLTRGVLSGAAWGPRLYADFTRLASGEVAVDVEAEVYQSLAAYSDGQSAPDVVRIRIEGVELRNLIREDPSSILGLFALVDKALKAKLGGDVIPATLPPWAADPPETP